MFVLPRWGAVVALACAVGCGVSSPLGPSYSLEDSPEKAKVTLTTSAGEIPIELPKARAFGNYRGTGTEQGSRTIDGQTVNYQIKYTQIGDQLTVTSLVVDGQELVVDAASDQPASEEPSGDWSSVALGGGPVPVTPTSDSVEPEPAPEPSPQGSSQPGSSPSPAGEILAELSEAKSTLQFAKRYFTVNYHFPGGLPRGVGGVYWVVESASGERAQREVRGFELRESGKLAGQIVFNRYDAPFSTYLEFGTRNPVGQRQRITDVVTFEEPPPPPSGPVGAGGSGPPGGGPRGPFGPRRSGR